MSDVKNKEQVFTKESLKKMKAGDTFETEGLFQGVCDEKVKWVVKKKSKNGNLAFFETYYFGVFFGDFIVEVSKGDEIKMVPV